MEVGVDVSVPIGEFSRLTHLTIKTLRHYHDLGLLVPDDIDRYTGYRRYGTRQIEDALLIGRLRGLDMPLAGIGQLLSAPSPAARDAVLAEHLRRMERELERTRDIVSSLRELLVPAAPLAVEYRTLPDLTVLAVRDRVDRDAIDAWCTDAFSGLYRSLRGAIPAGSAGATYGDEFFTAGAGDVVAYVPVRPDAPVDTERLPGGRFAIGLHAGPFATLDRTYAALGAHVAEHATVVPGPIREIYLISPQHTDDPAAHRTQVCWPVAA
jgi:DNA-binding transcriptional MerR regulator/effector-binding domain-containing protein